MNLPPFSVASPGHGRLKITILTRAPRTFYALAGARCVVEGGTHDMLRQWLDSASGDALATQLAIDENRISKIRAALSMSMVRGGRRKGAWREYQAATLPTNQLKLVGSERSAILVVSATPTAWAVVPTTQIVYEIRLKATIKKWLDETTIPDAAHALGLNPKRVQAMRKYLGAFRESGTNAIVL